MYAQDGLPPQQRRWAMLTIAIAVTMAVLDGAITNIALPTIARDLHVEAADAIWVVNAYQLAVTVSLLPLAALGDIFGYRRIYGVGLAIFTLASLACAMSHSLPALSLARVVQGFGAAGLMSVNTALIRFIYPRAMLGRGVGLNALVVATASALGPSVAAAILSVASWPWLFAVNVPLGALALGLAAPLLPRSPRAPNAFDLPSAGLSALTFGLLITGIDNLGRLSPLVAVELAGAALAGFILVRRQLALDAPLLAVDLFKRPVFSLSVATSICSFTAQGLAFVALPFYLEDVLGRSQVETGLLMTPWPLAVAFVAPIAGRLADRYPAGILGGLGLAALSVGLLLVASMPAHAGLHDMAWRMAICGVGFGFFQSPNNRAILTSAPRERSGSASGILATARLIGQTTGAATVAVIFGLTGVAAAAAATGATAAVLLGAGFAAAGAVASSLRLFGQSRQTLSETGD